MPGFEKQAPSRPDGPEIKTINLDNLEEELQEMFGDVDVEAVKFEKPKEDTESEENVFLAQNPDAREVIEEHGNKKVVYESPDGKVLDRDAEKELAAAQFKGEARQVFEGLVRERGFGENAKNELHGELKGILESAEMMGDMSNEIEKKLEMIAKTLEEKADEIEMREAMNTDSNT